MGIAADFDGESVGVFEVDALAGGAGDGAFEGDVGLMEKGDSPLERLRQRAFHLVGGDVEGEMIGAGEAFFGVGIGGGEVWLPEQIENGAVWGFEVGDFASSDELNERFRDFVACEPVQAEDGAVKVAGRLHILNVEGDVVNAA